ncbi:MAG TPA: imidazole glycerol phosphate synthase subunit HisH [Candidatus Binatia bacterium]|nr:imidazole glycerol phosphate synthase subunit HisH [Candidatus Binatia bacterium]
MIAILDYGAGNLASVVKAVRHLGQECAVTADAGDVRRAARVIIPGVGNFRATQALAMQPLSDALQQVIAAGKPILGICLGLQWMFEGSDEAPELPGLGAYAGACQRFSDRVKSPHVGWNRIAVEPQSRLLRGVPSGSWVYFTHSYRAPLCAETVASCTYESQFTAAVERDNLFGLQFHPEKSGDAGLAILGNFCAV